MQELMAETKIQDFTKLRKQVLLLKLKFDRKFTDLQEDVKYIQLFTHSFSILPTKIAINSAHLRVKVLITKSRGIACKF
jgi:hypothetical protein